MVKIADLTVLELELELELQSAMVRRYVMGMTKRLLKRVYFRSCNMGTRFPKIAILLKIGTLLFLAFQSDGTCCQQSNLLMTLYCFMATERNFNKYAWPSSLALLLCCCS